MLTRDQVLEQVKAGRRSECLDGRDFGRLAEFFPVEDWAVLGKKPAVTFDPDNYTNKVWMRQNFLNALANDLSFGFEKALYKRGISAQLMHSCVKQWLWILEDPLYAEADDLYSQYGLPFFKAVALKYDLPNPIGDDVGNEYKYCAESDA